jgi:hypothetical protein
MGMKVKDKIRSDKRHTHLDYDATIATSHLRTEEAEKHDMIAPARYDSSMTSSWYSSSDARWPMETKAMPRSRSRA